MNCGDIPLHSPYIGLIYGRYLQFRFLKWPLIYGICLISSTYSVDIQFDASEFHHEFWINISQKMVIAGTMVIFHPGWNFRCRSAASPPGCHLAPLQCWLSAGDLRHGRETPIFHGKIIELFHGKRRIFQHAMFGKRVNDVNVQLSIFFDLLKSHSNFNLAIEIRSSTVHLNQGCGTAARPAVLTSQVPSSLPIIRGVAPIWTRSWPSPVRKVGFH